MAADQLKDIWTKHRELGENHPDVLDEFNEGADDTHHRTTSAQRGIERYGFTGPEVQRAYSLSDEELQEVLQRCTAKSGNEDEPVLTVPMGDGDGKLSQEEVNYRPSDSQKCCGNCDMLNEQGTHCSLVEDPIYEDGYCDRYEASEELTNTAV